MAQNLVNALAESSHSQSPQFITQESLCEERQECNGDFQNYHLRNLKNEICDGEFSNSLNSIKQEWIIIKDEPGKNRLDALGNTNPILLSVESIKTERTETEENEENGSSKSDSNKNNYKFNMELKEEICDDYLDMPSLVKPEELVLKKEVEQNRYPSEVGEPNNMNQCAQCDYQTIRKDNLKKHFLSHEKSGEAVMYKCDQCDYQTNRKYNLKKHYLIHKKPGETFMYKCDKCDYQTIRKNNLKAHFIIHKKSVVEKVYTCDKCGYQTLKEWYLKKHFLIHEKPRKGNV